MCWVGSRSFYEQSLLNRIFLSFSNDLPLSILSLLKEKALSHIIIRLEFSQIYHNVHEWSGVLPRDIKNLRYFTFQTSNIKLYPALVILTDVSNTLSFFKWHELPLIKLYFIWSEFRLLKLPRRVKEL